MLVLLFFTFSGLLVSFVAHIYVMLGFSLPVDKMAMILNIGMVLSLCIRLIITRELRQGDDWFFGKNLKNICPRWLKVSASLIISYGLINFVIHFIWIFSRISGTMTDAEYVIAFKNVHVAFFSLAMAAYALEFLHTYLYKILKETKRKELDSSESDKSFQDMEFCILERDEN